MYGSSSTICSCLHRLLFPALDAPLSSMTVGVTRDIDSILLRLSSGVLPYYCRYDEIRQQTAMLLGLFRWQVVPCGRHSNHIQHWNDPDVLAAIAGRKIGVVSAHSRDPPVIAIGAVFRIPAGAVGLRRCLNVLRWHDLRAIPRPLIQVEIAELRHIAGGQEQSPTTETDALRIRLPDGGGDSKRRKQLLGCICLRAHVGRLG